MSLIEADTSATLSGSTRTSFAGRLKTDFLAKWDDHVHTKTPIASKVANKKGTMGGSYSLGSVATSLPQSAGIALGEGATLPTPSSGTYIQPQLYARDLYMRLRWSGQVERAARRGDKYAWTQPRAEDIKNATAQFNINFARMLYLGRYQALGTVSSNTTVTTTLYGRDDRNSASASFWKFGAHYLRINQEVDFLDSLTGNPVLGSAMTISAIDTSTPSAPTITTNNPGTDPTDGDLLIPFGSRNATVASANNSSEFFGVSGLLEYCSDQNLYAAVYDIARSGASTLEGVHLKAGGVVRAFDENLISLAVDNVVDNGVGEEPTDLCMHSSVRQQYVKQGQGDRRFAPVQKDKGYSGRLVFNAGDAPLPIMTDRDCPPGLAFVLNTNDWGWLSHSEMGPIDSQSERFVADQDSREVIMHKAGNVFCEKPFNQGIIDDILYDTDALTA